MFLQKQQIILEHSGHQLKCTVFDQQIQSQSIDRYMEYVQGSTKCCTHRWRDKCAEKRMKLCDTTLTSYGMLKYNRRQNTGTDKLHNISIIKYAQPDRLQEKVKSIHLLTIQEHTDWETIIGKKRYIPEIGHIYHSLLSSWIFSQRSVF